MTGSDVFESPAVRVLLELERLECRLELDQAGRLHVSPRSRIPGALLDKLPEVTDELKLLVRICDDGTQERVESFKRQLADTPADQIPAFLFRPDVPYVRGSCFSCGTGLPEVPYGRCQRCSLAWRLAARVNIPPELAAAIDEARVA